MNTQKAEKIIREIGEFQVQAQRARQESEEQIKKIRNKANVKIRFKQRAIDRRLILLYIFYKRNWEELTSAGKRKIVKFVNGEIGEYLTPPGVTVRNKKNVIKALETKELDKFVRTIKEVDKEAILMSPEEVVEISGIKVSQKERFGVTPKQTKEIVAADAKKLKKFLY